MGETLFWKDVRVLYSTEQELVECFLEQLVADGPWEAVNFNVEFNYMRGKTDIIAVSVSNELIAIEAKLSKWRSALHQAYRNRCFADKSYVLLPLKTAELANSYEHEFDRRGVGICCIQDGQITILKEAVADTPAQPWLKEVALQYVSKG